MRRAAVDDVLQERRVAEQHHLGEGRRQLANDSQDLLLIVARRDHGDRITLGREQPATARGVHAADPRPRRETDHREGGAGVGMEAVVRICSKRAAIATSSEANRGQKVGAPVEPDETAIKSQLCRLPSRQRSACG